MYEKRNVMALTSFAVFPFISLSAKTQCLISQTIEKPPKDYFAKIQSNKAEKEHTKRKLKMYLFLVAYPRIHFFIAHRLFSCPPNTADKRH